MMMMMMMMMMTTTTTTTTTTMTTTTTTYFFLELLITSIGSKADGWSVCILLISRTNREPMLVFGGVKEPKG